MSGDPTRRLIDALAQDLVPVRPIPPLRAGVAAVLGVGLAGALVLVLRTGMRPELTAAFASAPFASVGVGLLLAALGGVVAALAASVPGREREARAGTAIAALGVLLAAGGAALLLALRGALGAGAWPGPVPISGHLGCLARALALGLAPLAVASFYVVRAVPRDARALALTGAAGCAALGALAVHLTCRVEGALHLLAGHALAPLAGLLVGAPALWLLFRSVRRG